MKLLTLAELAAVLDKVLPSRVVYRQWHANDPNTPTAPPFIAYYEAEDANFAADGIVYQPLTEVNIELYTANKDLTLEGQLEAALTKAGLFYGKYEDYVDDERLYLITYNVMI